MHCDVLTTTAVLMLMSLLYCTTQVSMPTGSLCAERNVIGTALADDLTLRRMDLRMVAVLGVTLQSTNSSSSSVTVTTDPLTHTTTATSVTVSGDAATPTLQPISMQQQQQLLHHAHSSSCCTSAAATPCREVYTNGSSVPNSASNSNYYQFSLDNTPAVSPVVGSGTTASSNATLER
jgi:A distinct subfamily of CDD/CDA-like deaminases